MQIQTKTMGTVEIDDAQKILFPEGLFGFEDMKEFALLDSETKPFYYLQSIQESQLAFLVVDPFIFCQNYEVDIPDSNLAKIRIESPNEILIFSIITAPKDGGEITANLQGPVIINKKARMAMQVISDDPRWTTKHSLLPKNQKEAAC